MKLQGVWRDESGASLVEFALVAPLFLGLLIATIEVGVLEMVSMNFNNGVLAASRQIRTGQSDGPKSAQDFKQHICEGMAALGDKCETHVIVDVRHFDTFAAAAAAPPAPLPGDDDAPTNGEGAWDPGPRSGIVLVTATYRWTYLTPFIGDAFRRDGTDVLMTSRVIFRNEPEA